MIYLDNAATTIMYSDVADMMRDYQTKSYYNSNSPYTSARMVNKELEGARESLRKCIGADDGQLLFTSCGSEGNSLVVLGTALFYLSRHEECHIITSSIEHHSILGATDAAKKYGAKVTYLDVDEYGVVDAEQLKRSLNSNTRLVSIMMANNELGTIEPIGRLCEIVKGYDDKIIFHTDAVQAFPRLSIDVDELGLDMLTVSGHKFGGPKGVGFLWCKDITRLDNIIYGGSQEFGKRGGTHNTSCIIGMAKAACLTMESKKQIGNAIKELADFFISQVTSEIDGVRINSPICQGRGYCLDNIINLSFDDVDGERLVAMLDHDGIMCSRASACEDSSMNLSHVLKAIGLSDKRIKESIRISLGVDNTKDELIEVLNVLKHRVELIRKMQ